MLRNRGAPPAEEILINLQGDEPLMHPTVFDALAGPIRSGPQARIFAVSPPPEGPDGLPRPPEARAGVGGRGNAPGKLLAVERRICARKKR